MEKNKNKKKIRGTIEKEIKISKKIDLNNKLILDTFWNLFFLKKYFDF